MSIQFAARELLLEIFHYLPRSSLLQCASVCQTWSIPAIQLFYEHVELTEKTKLVWLQHDVLTKSKGIYVKKLTVNLAFSTTMTQTDFLKVLSYLPFVKSIDLNSSGYKLHYLAYLTKRELGCVTWLEDIFTGDLFTDYQMQQYFLCAYSFRHSLKNLTLRNPTSALYDGRTALSVLNTFQHLNHISIISDTPADNNELSILMNSFGVCSNLIRFTFKSTYLQLNHPPNYEEFHQLQKASRFQCVHLQHIELILPILTEHYIKNIIYTFPIHLKTLDIIMTHTDYTTWIQQCNELFGVYLGYVKHLKLSISNFNRRGNNNRNNTGTYIQKFWLLIQSIMGGKRLIFQLKFTCNKPGTSPDFCIEKDEQYLILSYNVDSTRDALNCLKELSQLGVTFDSILFPLLSSVQNDNLDAVQQCLSLCCTTSILFQFQANKSSIELGSSPQAYAVLKNIDLTFFAPISSLIPNMTLLKLLDYQVFNDDQQENLFAIDVTSIHHHLCQCVLDFDFLNPFCYPSLIKIESEITKQVNYYQLNRDHLLLESALIVDDNKYKSFVYINCRHIDNIICTRKEEHIMLGTITL